MHVERTFTVSRPVEVVFDYLADFTRTEEWDPGTVTTTRESGGGEVGTTYANVSEFMGRRVELTYETVVHESPTQLRFTGRNKSSTATDSLTFTARTATETEIHYRADFAFHGWLRFVAPLLIRRRLDRLADETVAQLREALLRSA